MVDDWFLEHVAKVTTLSCVLIVVYFLVYSIWRITRMPNYPWNWNEWQWPLGGGRNAVEIYRKATEMPFTLSLEDNSVEDVNQITFTLNYVKERPVPQVTVMWGPSVSYLMRIINSSWGVLNEELKISELDIGEWKSLLDSSFENCDRSHAVDILKYFIVQRFELPHGATEQLPSTGMTSSYNSVKFVVSPPVDFDWSLFTNQFLYPAAIFVTTQSLLSDNFACSIDGIVQIVHVKNEVYSKASSTLAQYIKMNNGQCHMLQSLYVMDDHRADEEELEESLVQGESQPFNDVLCSVCQVYPVSRVIIPCRHVCLCAQCFQKVEFCPICRGAILYYFKTRREPNLATISNETGHEEPEQLTWWQRVERWNERFSDATGLIRH